MTWSVDRAFAADLASTRLDRPADQRHRRALAPPEKGTASEVRETPRSRAAGPSAFREHAESAGRHPRASAAPWRNYLSASPTQLAEAAAREQSRGRAHAGRATRPGAAAGKRAWRLRRQGRGQEHSPGSRGHALRVRAGARRQVGARDRACRRHCALPGRGFRARRHRARTQRHRHRAAELPARKGQFAAAARVGTFRTSTSPR